MFKNRHIVAALIIAPILSIISYFSVDFVISETPHKAVKGNAYPLAEKPNCRYSSGVCELKNGDFSIKLIAQNNENGELDLHLSSEHPIQIASLAVVEDTDTTSSPSPMEASAEDGTQWVANISKPLSERQMPRLRVAVSVNDTFYYAESSLAFVQYETAYEKDFR